MFETIKEFIMHPIKFMIYKILNERQKEKLARFKEKEDRVMKNIARNIIPRIIKDDEKLEVIRKELEISSIGSRILSILRTIVIFILVILLLCGRETI